MNRPRTYDCVECGRRVTRLRQTGEPLICAECGKARAGEWSDRIHQLAAAERAARAAQAAGALLESSQQ